MGSSFLKGKKQKGQLYIYNLTSVECRVIFQKLLWARNTLGRGRGVGGSAPLAQEEFKLPFRGNNKMNPRSFQGHDDTA